MFMITFTVFAACSDVIRFGLARSTVKRATMEAPLNGSEEKWT
jgi:hypothetical protein